MQLLIIYLYYLKSMDIFLIQHEIKAFNFMNNNSILKIAAIKNSYAILQSGLTHNPIFNNMRTTLHLQF